MTNDKKMSVPSAEDIHIASESGEEAVVCLIGNLPNIIRELQAQIARDSGNSSRPDGGQPGHKGHHPEQISDPDHVIIHKIGWCESCNPMERIFSAKYGEDIYSNCRKECLQCHRSCSESI